MSYHLVDATSSQPSSKRIWVSAAVVGASVVPVVFVCFVVQNAVLTDANSPVNLAGLGFLYAIIGTATACALISVAVGKPPRARGYILIATIIGLLAGLAPISSVVFLRLSSHSCAAMNLLLLPWPEPWREIAHIGAGLIWLASTVFLIVAVTRPRLRAAGVAMWIWSAAVTIPTFFLYFLTVYGDPDPGCAAV